ncbi:MAG: O-antigen ligase family protein, partial [Clostridia bacterium]|nr:O-antigen ligase family protein [Clostridia bacterium]
LKASYYMIPLYVFAIMLADYYKIEVGYMVLSYALLPFVLVVMQDMFRKTTRKNLIFFLIGLITIILKGARGALLCIIVGVILNTLFSVNGKKRYFSFILLTVVAVFLATPMYNDALLDLSSFLQEHDISSRTITKLANDEIQDDNGRSSFAGAAVDWIKKAPVIGYGLCGDRVLIGRTLNTKPNYPHNLLLELMMHLGALGAVFFLWFLIRVLYVLVKVRDQYLKMIIMSIIPVVFVKLFLSSTYVAEIPFFMLLAIAFSVNGKRIKEINETTDECVENKK